MVTLLIFMNFMNFCEFSHMDLSHRHLRSPLHHHMIVPSKKTSFLFQAQLFSPAQHMPKHGDLGLLSAPFFHHLFSTDPVGHEN